MANARLGDLDLARQSYLSAQEVLAGMEDQPRILEAELRIADLDRREVHPEHAVERVQAVLNQATDGGFDLTRLRALNALARLDSDAANVDSAIAHYSEVIEGLKDKNWTGLEASAVTGLADIFLDLEQVELAEPLIGKISQHTDIFSGLLVRARFYAAQLMREARDLAGERWMPHHDETLAGYVNPSSTGL